MQNHFEKGYTFMLDGVVRYIQNIDFENGYPEYETYPVLKAELIEQNPDLLFDLDFVDTYRICLREHELYEARIQFLEEQLSKPAEKISVETSLGTLEATIGGDPTNYPEIFTYIKRPDGTEVDLVAVGVSKKSRITKAYLYGDTASDDYTQSHVWSEDELNRQFD